MSIKFNSGKSKINYHGTQAKGEPWNNKTVCGPKLTCIDLLKDIKKFEKSNPEGGKTRARWYKRFIFYFPSGVWCYLDIALII